MSAYGSLCVEFYDLDKPSPPKDALTFYVEQARRAGGRILEPMCGSGRFLLPMTQAGLTVDGVDSSPAMLKACQAHALRFGLDVMLYRQELASLELPHKYAMAFVPSGSINLITNEQELDRALLRLRSHLQDDGVIYIELAANWGVPDSPTEIPPRTVMCADGAAITYTCIASRHSDRDLLRFRGRYEKAVGARAVETEEEELVLRLYEAPAVLAKLTACGFGSARVLSPSELTFLAESGCVLVEARAVASASLATGATPLYVD